VRRHLEDAARALQALAAAEPEVAARVRVEEGVAERLAEPDGSVDLIWCRDVLGHIQDLEVVFGEFGRVLRPSGAAVIYQMTATDWLTPAEAARLWPPLGIYASSVDPQRFEAAIAAGGLGIGQCIPLAGNGASETRRTAAAAPASSCCMSPGYCATARPTRNGSAPTRMRRCLATACGACTR
jgi:SAM-dependent methyltransferase